MASRIGKIKLGSQGLEVSAQGLGCMGMSDFYGPLKPEQDMITLIYHAIHNGVTFLDTADIYGPFTNEILLGKVRFEGRDREKVQLATKFANSFEDGKWVIRGNPAYVRVACEVSLKRLDVDCIDLYYQHRIDTSVPIEVTIGELKKLVEEGKIKYIGLSEASASTIRRAHAVHPITAVQLEWSLWSRDVEEEIIPTCRELGIGIVAYSPLGRGFFSTGPKLIETLSNDDVRKVEQIDASPSEECRGRYIQVRVNIDIRQPISRGRFVDVGDSKPLWISLQYERMPYFATGVRNGNRSGLGWVF
ncbi:hypothetical protein SO802_026320 [Lithocarpus litseifolius]|uniref:NADP-dependent oxidoreductase domain-containing protein n=1 Tax=Lithocarpus litseifolius TaxID=425828 RepID=A0AAW2C4L3_9ROSI